MKQLTICFTVVCIGMKDNKDIEPEINKFGVRSLNITDLCGFGLTFNALAVY